MAETEERDPEDRPVNGTALSSLPGASADSRVRVPDGPYLRWGKRVLNLALLVVALPLGLAVALPVGLLNALAMRDPRRVLFRQRRIGLGGREFTMWKFRTMRDETPEGEFRSWQLGEDQSRVTRFGRFLRSTHLDELPQLINVVLGDMDFIGPRPEMRRVHHWACERIPRFDERTVIRPGITGLAQVTQGYVGCDERAYRTKLSCDLAYARRVSLRLDLAILLRTVTWMLMGRGWNRIDLEGTLGVEVHAPEATMKACPTDAIRPAIPAPHRFEAPASSATRASASTTPGRRTPSARAD